MRFCDTIERVDSYVIHSTCDLKRFKTPYIPPLKLRRIFLKGDELGADSFQKAFVCLSRRCEKCL